MMEIFEGQTLMKNVIFQMMILTVCMSQKHEKHENDVRRENDESYDQQTFRLPRKQRASRSVEKVLKLIQPWLNQLFYEYH